MQRRAKWVAITAIAAGIAVYYEWAARAAGNEFVWGRDLNGYYNLLGRSLAKGQLHVPVEPKPALLALPDPWDPKVDETLKMHDMVLFNRRYYLYHGAGPAALLFAPWRRLTGHDLPENFGLFLLCLGGFLCAGGALVKWLEIEGVRLGAGQWALLFLALGVCQCVPFLLSRVWVYEIAIGGGYFCVSVGLFCLAMGMPGRPAWLAASGAMVGMAVACRPHLGLAAAVPVAAILCGDGPRWRRLATFAAPLATVGLLIAAYNWARFGSPVEFGIRYILAGANQNRIRLSFRNLGPGLYFLLGCAPDFSPVFPWVRPAFRYPFNSLDYPFPPGYVIEKTVGALYLAPLVVLATPVGRVLRPVLVALLGSATAVLLFLAATGWVTQRYLVDFLPLAVLASVVSLGIRMGRSGGWRRAAWTAALAILAMAGAVVNLALGFSGYDEMLRNKPARYLRIAGWFSPSADLRPLWNPSVTAECRVVFSAHYAGFRDPLVTIGHQAFRHFVYAEHQSGKLILVSEAEGSRLTHEMPLPGDRPVAVRVVYTPETGTVTTTLDGREVLAHRTGTLVTAPAQVTVGENRIDANVCEHRFTGHLTGARKTVVAHR